ncbi:Mpo1-like protein [Sneathiella sp.]|uniref:Mpo1-like protein n=1 Tax=Sneathiella sp. TaxID=1964365 RepID=UPI0039E42190
MTRQSRDERFSSFKEFYPFYLSEHSNVTCRRLHFVGSLLVLVTLVAALWSGMWFLLWWLPVIGYGFAWVGHFFFEKNRPATFKYPFYSLFGDWVMFKDILIGRVRLF